MPELTIEMIDWDNIPEKFDFVTQDGNGRVFMHTMMPEAYGHKKCWNGAGMVGSGRMSYPVNGLFPDWIETLAELQPGEDGYDDGWRWLGMGSCGGWWRYTHKPMQFEEGWFHSGEGSADLVSDVYSFWQRAIYERP